MNSRITNPATIRHSASHPITSFATSTSHFLRRWGNSRHRRHAASAANIMISHQLVQRRQVLLPTLLLSCILVCCTGLSACLLPCDKGISRTVSLGRLRDVASRSVQISPFRRCRESCFPLRSTAEWVGLQGDAASYDSHQDQVGDSGKSSRASSKHSFLAAMEPGSTVRIQIGDTSLARKAWKKRRRNKSPLLVPCSLLTKDLRSSLQDNILYLVKKFGSPRLSVSELLSRHRTHLLAPLSPRNFDNAATDAAAAAATSLMSEVLSDDSSSTEESLTQLLLHLFPPGNQHGLEVSQRGESGQWSLQLRGVSSTKARKQAAATAVVQFRDGSSDVCHDGLCWEHTGLVRTKSSDGKYMLRPLSAALRVPNHQNGDLLATLGSDSDNIVTAFVWDFDVHGDAGSPMVILSLQPPLP